MTERMIWAPWRSAFILRKKEKGCIFCKRLKMKDSLENLIIHRGRQSFVILNKFPYNSGHTLVVSNRHIGQIEKLSVEEAAEFFELVRRSVVAIKRALRPDALNVGMNLGPLAGAGLPGHVHMHIVPRWQGDTNFMPVIGKTLVISVPLEPIYKALRKEFARR